MGRRTATRFAAVFVIAVSCVTTDEAPPSPLPSGLQGLVGTWFGPDGEPLPTGQPFVMDLYRGPTHCDWQDHLFLIVSWPIGSHVPGPFMSSRHTRMFVRPPGASTKLDAYLATTFDADADLPSTARDSGYTREGWHLWVDDQRIGRAVWLVDADSIERWPAATEMIVCA